MPRPRRLRVYDQLRTAHLERARELEPASIAYRARSYDFDDALARGLDLVPVDGDADLLRLLLRSDVRELEVNEPLMLQALRTTLVSVTGARLAGLLRGHRVRVVSYAIENGDPLGSSSRRLRTPVRRWAYRLAARAAYRQLDRIAFGTTGAEQSYAALPRSRRTRATVLPALSAPCDCLGATGPRPPTLLFVGAFDDRKGVLPLLAVWPLVAREVTGARLVVVGQGVHQDRVEALVASRDDVELHVDPPRAEVHALMRHARVLVLWSQPSPTWREQVGLPLVEGLAHGCQVVASDETGIAGWLHEHGHDVVDAVSGEPGLQRALVRALTSERTPDDVLADLPATDGRLAADRWLWS